MDRKLRLLQYTAAWTHFIRLHALQLETQKKQWVRPYLKDRNQHANHLLNKILEEEFDNTVVNFIRLSRTDFEYLLSLISPMIGKHDTNMREAISARERFIITLRFLATGDNYKSLEYTTKVSAQSISLFVPEVCDALIKVLRDYIKLPTTSDEWIQISESFQEQLKFPHAIGAIDGRHIPIKAPSLSGSDYINYKKFFSIVLLAVVDANCNFIFADVGSKGRISDSGVLRNSRLYELLENKMLNIPEPRTIREGSFVKVPYMLLGDSAFAFTEYCIRPFGGEPDRLNSTERLFNDTHSSARRVVEMAFGILSGRFRVLRKCMELEPEQASKITLASVYLHNFIRRANSVRLIDNVVFHTNNTETPLTNLSGIRLRSSDQLNQIRLYLANEFATNV